MNLKFFFEKFAPSLRIWKIKMRKFSNFFKNLIFDKKLFCFLDKTEPFGTGYFWDTNLEKGFFLKICEPKTKFLKMNSQIYKDFL